MKLGTLLLRDAVLTLGQLEEALRAQVLYGGRLGTNLVELGFLDLETLGRCLAKVSGAPLASQDRFEQVHPTTVESFPVALAHELVAFPLGPELRSPEILGVALADPRPVTVDEVASRLGGFIAPYVAPELRILYYVERHYRVKRAARFLRPPGERDAAGERRRTQRATAAPQPVRFEPRSQRSAREPTREPPLREARVSYLAACNAIDEAGHRDEIADALLQFCAGRFGAAVIFILKNASAIGWRALGGDGPVGRAVAQLSLPLGASSALQVANDSGEPYRGAPPSAGRPIERHLWRELGVSGEPAEIAVVPIVVRRRVVNLIYVHGFAGSPLDGGHCDELGDLARRAADAFLRLIQAAKEQGP